MTRASNFAFGLALVLYLVAMVAYLHHFAYRRRGSWLVGVSLATVGAATHLTSIVLRGVAAERVPWGNMYEYASAVGFLVVAGYLVLERMTRVRTVGGFAVGAAVLSMAGATMLYVPPGPLVPALNSYWIKIHVVAAMLGSAMFTLGFVFSLLYLVRARRERREAALLASTAAPAMATVGGGGLPEDYAEGADDPEGPVGGSKRGLLPGSRVLDRLAYRTIAFGFPIWTFAVIAGAIWAQQAWGRYWGWDPKEVWSFITWVVFAGYLHARATVGWRGARAAVLAIVGFAALVFNLVIVNLVVTGLHSYAGV